MSSKNTPASSGAPTPALTRAVKQLLKPLVGLLLDNGLTYGWLTKVLKVIYVDVAENEFGLPNKSQTDSRISLLTGLHRKDVRRLRSEDKEAFEPPSSIFLGAQLVAIWTTEPRFVDAEGQPRPLKRLPGDAHESGALCFEDLVTLVSKDIRPRAILDEWHRLGAVTINAADEVCLQVGAFIPARGFEEKVYYLGKNIHDHMAAARFNVANEKPPFLERSVYYDGLSPGSVEKLAAMAEQGGMDLLKHLNQEARRFQKKDEREEIADQRMNFGIYFFNEQDK